MVVEKSLEELRELFNKPLDPKFKSKIIKRGKRLNQGTINQCNENKDQYPPNIQKYIYDGFAALLGRKPTAGELQNILKLWHEYNEKTQCE